MEYTMIPVPENLVASLTTSVEPFQQSLIREILLGGGIVFETREPGPGSWLMGTANPLLPTEFLVPAERLQEAKDLLCAHGIVCDVSERLLRRSFEEIVKPLLGAPGRSLDRLVYFVGINNKETLRALFQATAKESGGLDLLEDLFFAMAGEGTTHLLVLARVLEPLVESSFGKRFSTAAFFVRSIP